MYPLFLCHKLMSHSHLFTALEFSLLALLRALLSKTGTLLLSASCSLASRTPPPGLTPDPPPGSTSALFACRLS